MANTLLKSVSLALAVGLATPAPAATKVALKDGPVLTVLEPITRSTIAPLMDYMDKLLVSSEPAPSNINIILDSPGGSVNAGFTFISRMNLLKARNTKFTCYVIDMAASMAFHFLTQCDTRIVLDKSALLWHRARVQAGSTPITAPLAMDLSRDLQAVDDIIFIDLMKTVGKTMAHEDLAYHFEKETLHVGLALCTKVPTFCTNVSSVAGLMEATKSKDAVHANPYNPFGLFMLPGTTKETETKWNIEYIWSGYEVQDTQDGSK